MKFIKFNKTKDLDFLNNPAWITINYKDINNFSIVFNHIGKFYGKVYDFERSWLGEGYYRLKTAVCRFPNDWSMVSRLVPVGKTHIVTDQMQEDMILQTAKVQGKITIHDVPDTTSSNQSPLRKLLRSFS